MDTDLPSGTKIEFEPDPEVYNLEPINIDFNFLCETCKNLSYLTKGLEFILKNKNKTLSFKADNGIKDLIIDVAKNKINNTPLYAKIEEDGQEVEIAMCWTKNEEKFFVFTNGLLNSEGGTPLTGFKTSLTRKMNKVLGVKFNGDMARTGLVYAINCKVKNPSFANQTKTKINNPELRTMADKACSDAIDEFKKIESKQFDSIREFLIREVKADEAAEKARQAVYNAQKDILELNKKKMNFNTKLKDCVKHGEDSILCIVEGETK